MRIETFIMTIAKAGEIDPAGNMYTTEALRNAAKGPLPSTCVRLWYDEHRAALMAEVDPSKIITMTVTR